jgi:hypothetical protein
MIRLRFLSLALAIGLAATLAAPAARAAKAETGPAGFIKEFGTMWTFDAPPLEYWKATYGFTPDQAWLDHVRLASVRLPNCSSSFVSANGLIMTNHHCARSCISAVSPADTNYQRTGFVARTQEEEKRCPGLYVDQLQSISDVTPRIRSAATAAAAAKRMAQRDSAIDTIQRECSGGDSTTICQVVTFYQGGMYSLYKYRRFADLRLVMAPEEEISFFGGDPDNFTYPRYDLDISLLRAYQDGKPMQVRDYLKWSKDGAKEGDLVLVTGNPGSTGRLLTMAQLEWLRDVQYPGTLAAFQRQIAIYQDVSSKSEEARRKYENTIFGLQNSFKAITGYRAGLLDSTIMAKKAAFERDFRGRIAADPKLKAQYGSAWDAIAGAIREERSFAREARYYGFGGSQLLGLAGALVRIPEQAALPDSARLPQYRGEGLAAIKGIVTRDAQFDLDLEQRLLTAQLAAAKAELPASDPYLKAVLAGRSPESAAEALIRGTKLTDLSVRQELLDGGAKAVAASDDPLIVAARRIAPLSRAVASRSARLEAIVSANAEKVGRAIFAAYGKALPPDATFTLRISDGVMKGYPMNGTEAPAQTSFYGLYARSAEFGDKPPFHVPERWATRKDSLTMSKPLDFVTTNDIIGGNSGSPMINRDAEIVGLIFDGNIESLPNRFIFTDEVARSVGVHSVGIIEALRKIYAADRIADELEGRAGGV